MPGDRETGISKNRKYLYPKPTQVPLGEKLKVYRSNASEGNRQISPMASV